MAAPLVAQFAYHEAGHAVVTDVLGWPWVSVSLLRLSDGTPAGGQMVPYDRVSGTLGQELTVVVAGHAAERRYLSIHGPVDWEQAHLDYDKSDATALVAQHARDTDLAPWSREWTKEYILCPWVRAHDILRDHWDEVLELAETLVVKGYISRLLSGPPSSFQRR